MCRDAAVAQVDAADALIGTPRLVSRRGSDFWIRLKAAVSATLPKWRRSRCGAGGVRFLFACGTFTERQLEAIRLEVGGEIDEYRLVALPEATAMLSGPLRRRVSAGVAAPACVYLEDGRPVASVLG